MSSRSRKGRSHLRQKSKRQGGLNGSDFTDALNMKSAIRAGHYNRKHKKAGFFSLGGFGIGPFGYHSGHRGRSSKS